MKYCKSCGLCTLQDWTWIEGNDCVCDFNGYPHEWEDNPIVVRHSEVTDVLHAHYTGTVIHSSEELEGDPSLIISYNRYGICVAIQVLDVSELDPIGFKRTYEKSIPNPELFKAIWDWLRSLDR